MNLDNINQLIRNGKANELLAVDPTSLQVVFPNKNPAFLHVADPQFSTDLLNTLELFLLTQNELAKYPRQIREDLLPLVKEARKSYFKHTREDQMPEFKWRIFHNRLKAMTLDHYIRSVHAGTGSTSKEKTLFTGNRAETSETAVALGKRVKNRFKVLAAELITNNLFAPADPDEENITPDDAFIQDHILKELNIAKQPTSGASLLRFERASNEWHNAINRTRSTCSDVYCWLLFTFCNKQVQEELQQVHAQYLRKQVIDDSNLNFTAQVLVDHIESTYLSDNESYVRNLTRVFEKIIRYRRETLIKWLDRMTLMVDELTEARAGDDHEDSDEYQQKLWKITFAGNVSTSEVSLLDSRIAKYEDSSQQEKLMNYWKGDFEPMLMRQLLLDSALDLPSYNEPDKRVKTFNEARYSKLTLPKEKAMYPRYDPPSVDTAVITAPSKSTPDESSTKRKRDSHPSRKTATDSRSRPKRSKVPTSQQCKNVSCVNRGTHTGHTMSQCHYRTDKYINPRGTTKRTLQTDMTKSSARKKPGTSSKSFKTGSSTTHDLTSIQCYNCGDMGHYANKCLKPKKPQRFGDKDKQKEFKSYLSQVFPKPELRAAALDVVNSLNQTCCHNCVQQSCDGTRCNPRHRDTHDHIPEVMEILRDNPSLADEIMRANEPYQTTNVHAPLTVENYFAHHLYPEGESGSESEPEVSNEIHNFFAADVEEDGSSSPTPSGGREEQCINDGSTGLNQSHESDDELDPV